MAALTGARTANNRRIMVEPEVKAVEVGVQLHLQHKTREPSHFESDLSTFSKSGPRLSEEREMLTNGKNGGYAMKQARQVCAKNIRSRCTCARDFENHGRSTNITAEWEDAKKGRLYL